MQTGKALDALSDDAPTTFQEIYASIYFKWTIFVVLNCLSAILSGLVLGLLSLDITDLEILKKCGTDTERRNASAIIPMRKFSNLLLCSLVIGQVLTNVILTNICDSMFPGILGFAITTICLTFFGEIVPQAVCARYGLCIGANTLWLTWAVILITLPISLPVSVMLDCVLGEEIAFVYDRDRLQEYIRITRQYNNLDAQEVNIITGALKIKTCTVGQVMTKLTHVFMISVTAELDFKTISTIVKKGFSRVPIYDKQRNNIVGLLMIKDLALINPTTATQMKSILTFYKHPIISVDEKHTLDLVFNHFRGGKSHMALVREHGKTNIIGIVTLEDIIEEVLQVEINDETDIITDNREMKNRPEAQIPSNLDALPLHIDKSKRNKKKEVKNAKTVAQTTNGPKPSSLSNKSKKSKTTKRPKSTVDKGKTLA